MNRRLLGAVAALAVLCPALLFAQTAVVNRGRVSTTNATATPLTSGSTFTGAWEDTRDYGTVTVTAYADQASASNGLKAQWSTDATNVDYEYTATVSATVGVSYTSETKARYFRVSYVNGGTNQGTFRVGVLFRQSGVLAAASGAGGGLTDTELRATPVPVSGTVTANVGTGTQPVSGTVAATESGTWTVQPGNTANTTAWKVDGSAVTQPVSGTFWQSTQPVSATNLDVALSTRLKPADTLTAVTTVGAITNPVTVTDGAGALNVIVDSGAVTNTPPSNQMVDLNKVAGTAADVNSGTKSAGTLRVVLATDQPQLTNKLLVTPDSVALPANQTVDVNKLAGTTTDTNSGTKSAGTLRVVLATDQPALTNKLLVTPDSVALPANQSVNLAQVAGATTPTGNGPAAGTLRVDLPTDGTGVVGLNAGTNRIGSVRPVDSADADLTSVKGTQTSRAVGIQDLHDAGRTAISFYANAIASGTTGTETLITLTQSKGTSATSSASTYTITSGKTLRLTSITVASRGHLTATAQITTFNLRLNTGGACIVTSTPILAGMATATPATAQAWDRLSIPIPDGYELAGNGTIALCISANAVFTTNAPTWFVNLIGYEY